MTIAASTHDLWVPNRFNWEGRTRERAVHSYLGKIYMITDGRNAWHDTWVKRYDKFDGFTTSLKAAKDRVQQLRVQGSTWIIRELPAVVISGENATGYLFQINSSRPLSTHTYDLGSTITVKALLRRASKTYSPDILSRVGPARNTENTKLPFLLHKSSSYGGEYLLGWFPLNHKLDISGPADTAAAIAAHLQKQLEGR